MMRSLSAWVGGMAAPILPPRAAVAQLARASACHAEGRGFESLQPLRQKPRTCGAFARSVAVGLGSRIRRVAVGGVRSDLDRQFDELDDERVGAVSPLDD